MRYWKPEDIVLFDCPYCHGEIELWKDEPFRSCPSCGKEVRNPKQDFGCAKWCGHASDCLGSALGESGRLAPVSERILAAMVAVLGENHPQVRVAREGRQQNPDPPNPGESSLMVMRAVSMLRGLKTDRPGEPPPLARPILEEAGLAKGAIDEICQALKAQGT